MFWYVVVGFTVIFPSGTVFKEFSFSFLFHECCTTVSYAKVLLIFPLAVNISQVLTVRRVDISIYVTRYVESETTFAGSDENIFCGIARPNRIRDCVAIGCIADAVVSIVITFQCRSALDAATG